MMEKEVYFAWYRLRGLGLVCLCSFVFFFGAYLANQRSLAVSGSVKTQAMPVSCVERDDNRLALSFDVTEGSGSVQVLLDILAKYETKATFFVTGSWVDAHPEETRRIVSEGHEIGSRGTDRKSMTGKSGTEIRAILDEIRGKVEGLTGTRITLFRAPYGEYDDTLIRTAAAEGYLPIRWSVDSEDWKDYGMEAIVEKVTESSRLSGAIVLMHSGARYTAHALENIIMDLQGQGYELTPVSQLL